MDNSPLSTVPPELRTYIYEFCLITQTVRPIIVNNPSQPSPPALLQTCRQIRKECENLYYASNSFILTLPDKSSTTHFFAEWLETIRAENRKVLMKNVIVDITSKAMMKWGALVEGRSSWVHEEIGRIREIGSGFGKVRLSYLRKKLDLELKDLGESWKETIGFVKGMLREVGDGDEFMCLSYAEGHLKRLLELEEPGRRIGEEERRRRSDMKRALGIEEED
ncbi:hypothetical protein AC579_149 [Pseudocercospora musae]|uniref:Uncharacterized protein n=1 Tax=Pseudocercospora musae TaxID=113226 RepID=A0A139HME0_9PEZI|nr:hypothetical protein AC579_149 [Pseudocercospora musae]